MWFDAIRRSTAARIAGASMLLFTVAIAVSFATIYAVVNHDARERLKAAVTAEMRLVEEELQESDPEMVEVLAETAGPEAVRMIFGLDGTLIGGNATLPKWSDGWRVLEASKVRFDNDRRRASARYLLLGKTSGQYRILVGEGLHLGDAISEILSSAFLWGLMTVLVIGLAGIWLLARRALERLARVEAALTTFAEGNLRMRLPIAGKGDDIDRVSAAVNTALARIEELVQTVRQITTDIAHDLKSPMARLRQTLETMVRGGAAEEPALSAIAQADAITATFDALLRIAQIEAGARRARFRPVELSEILSSVVDAFGPAAEDKGERLIFAPAAPARINGDRELLAQLFANLVENAVHHGASCGAVAIGLRHADGQAIVTVADHGPGIPAEERERVLRRFYRLDRSRTTPGTGLGLALAKAIADLHGATLVLRDNAPGLTCELTFRAPPPETGSEQPDTGMPRPHLTKQ